MWERTLQDLIRGLRANKKDEAKFIAKAIEEIRQEIKGDDMELKAGAVMKLTYLDMLGYDMSWASFHVVEVMSSPRIHLKSVGYLAAGQSFDQDTDVLMLTTNLLKKAHVSVTLNGISNIVTSDLARDLSPELIRMLNHSRPHIRKRAVIALYKAIQRYPEVLQHSISRMREKLEDPDSGVVAATVNVLCELARRNPEDYLTLAPALFHLMTTSSNNWMLIKIIKIFGALSPYEPRLVRKLQPPITELITTTPAISLLYECVHTCITGGMLQGSSGDALARTCISKLAAFVEDPDQNLKYIALLAMVKIVPSHPHLVAQYQDTILSSVNDQDISIRMRALDLVSAMVDQTNLQSIVQQILSHLVTETTTTILPTAAQSLAQHAVPTSPNSTKPHVSPSQSPAYRLILAQRILRMCSQDTYENVTNFEWYLSVLVDLAHVANVDVGAQIRDQLVDVVGRVKAARRYAVKLMHTLLNDDIILRNAQDEGSCSEVLWAAAWICGEYCRSSQDDSASITEEITGLHPEIIAVYIQASVKIFGYWAAETALNWSEDDLQEVKDVVGMISSRVGEFVSSPHTEVQERAANTLQLFNFIQADLNNHRPRNDTFAGTSLDPISEPHFPKSLFLIQPLFSSYPLNPVAQTAQASVPVPEGLDLDAWIIPPPAVVELKMDEEKKAKKSKKGKGKEVDGSKSRNAKKRREEANGNETNGDVLIPTVEPESPEERAEREKRRAERQERLKDDPYYIMDNASRGVPTQKHSQDDIDSIPVVKLEGIPSFSDPQPSSILRADSPRANPEPYVIEKVGEMPEGASLPILSPQPTSSRPSSKSTPRQGTPVASPIPSRISSFPQYEVPGEEDARASTPEPVKVVRSKKKKTGASGSGTGTKKKRAAQEALS
ncbi:AP-3 complex subunit delta [Paramarasmius palmivorus]|uniref:AP-3 complex subunit delta n=1 Tax=Paramarasmius palmivorus TaxID=297713 RepID=A0AAW0CQ34_9AGAR